MGHPVLLPYFVRHPVLLPYFVGHPVLLPYFVVLIEFSVLQNWSVIPSDAN